MIIGLLSGYVVYKIVWCAILREYERRVEEATAYRNIVSSQLCEFIDHPPVSPRETKEWIQLARFSDELYFSAVPYMRGAERLENLAKRILE